MNLNKERKAIFICEPSKSCFFQIISVPYRIIFFIIRIAIKCDEKLYHPSPNQKAHDRKKDAYLKCKNIK